MMRPLLLVLALFALACGSAPPPAAAVPPATPTAMPPATAADAPPPVASTSAAAPAASAPASTPQAGQGVALANGGSGYLSLPQPPGRHPAILVIQEWWGMNDWIKSNADRFASQGYVALAVDLYRGRSTASPDEAHELMRGLPEDRGIADIKAAFDLLAARPDVDPARIGIVGWCMGGGFALDFATVEPRLRAAVVNYGHLFSDAGKIDAIHAALLGNFGAKDRGIPAADVNQFAAQLKGKGKAIDFKEYEGAGHAFMNPNNKEGYDDAAAKDAWGRIDAFFGRTLKGG
jgi:carboxymethylenebutenolidase